MDLQNQIITVNPLMMLPFAALLAAIALAPLLFAQWWERHYPKVVAVLGIIVLAYYLGGLREWARAMETAHDYVSFMAIVGSLFVISGGIHINVKGEATPLANVLFLLVGAMLANVLGATGASMLLIRPWLRTDRYRVDAHHVLFFIFIVSNVGGCLTPVGPPLFLGYLMGVPFWWVAARGFPIWLAGVGILLAFFLLIDYRNYVRLPAAVRAGRAGHPEQWRFDGLWNLFFVAVVLGAVFVNRPLFLREGLMIGAAGASYLTTLNEVQPKRRRKVVKAGYALIGGLGRLTLNRRRIGRRRRDVERNAIGDPMTRHRRRRICRVARRTEHFRQADYVSDAVAVASIRRAPARAGICPTRGAINFLGVRGDAVVTVPKEQMIIRPPGGRRGRELHVGLAGIGVRAECAEIGRLVGCDSVGAGPVACRHLNGIGVEAVQTLKLRRPCASAAR